MLLIQILKYRYLDLLILHKNAIALIEILDSTTLLPLSNLIKKKIFMVLIEFSNNLMKTVLSKKNKKYLKKIAKINEIILKQCHSDFYDQLRITTVAYCRRVGIHNISIKYPVSWLIEYYSFINGNS
jgi:hypothetical protein